MDKQPHPARWHSHHFYAMGSQIALWLDGDDSALTAAAFTQAEALFAHNESVLSRFRRTSELMQLNGRSGQWVELSDLLWREITLALGMASKTNGRFDPTLHNALAQSGYDRSFDLMGGVGNGRQLAPETLVGRWQEIALEKSRHAVRLPAGVQLDLGGIAKGDTAQQALALLQPVGPCLVDAGGDLVAGTAPPGHPGWPVALSRPGSERLSTPSDLATFWLADGTMATSGLDYRNWMQDGCLRHHLIDPRTGQPADTDVLTATVFAQTAAVAEAWATALLVAGSEAGISALLDADLAGLIVRRDGRMLATPQMDALLQGDAPALA